jgi:hypothetical protein
MSGISGNTISSIPSEVGDGLEAMADDGVRAGGFEPPQCFHQQDLNLPRLPFRHARWAGDARPCVTVPLSTGALVPEQEYPTAEHRSAGTGYAPSSVRSRATWPVALTPYNAFSILPSASITNVDLITPTVVLP